MGGGRLAPDSCAELRFDLRTYRMVVAASDLRVEQLCVHHSLATFSSGDDGIDAVARQLGEGVRRRNSEVFLTIVVTTASVDVVGIASVVDVYLEGDVDREGPSIGGPCVFVSLLAVDERYQDRPEVARMLGDEVELILERRYSRRTDYIGAIAVPVPSGFPSMERFLHRHGFTALSSDRMFWYRRRKSGHLD